MQVRLVERNRINEKGSDVFVEDLRKPDKLFAVLIGPKVDSQLERAVLRGCFALPIARHARREPVRRKWILVAIRPISGPIVTTIVIQAVCGPSSGVVAKIKLD